MFKDHNEYGKCESFLFLIVLVAGFIYFGFFT